MFVLITVFVGLGSGFAGQSVTHMIVDKTQFAFETDCKRAAETIENKWLIRPEKPGETRAGYATATCIYVR
jgi:hypothetical protein